MPHSDLSEVTRVVLVHRNAVVVLTSSKTTSSGGLAVLADTTVTAEEEKEQKRTERACEPKETGPSTPKRGIQSKKQGRTPRRVLGACGCSRNG